MNVLLIHQAFASAAEPGGTRHYELGQKLVERGHRFTVIASTLSYLTGQAEHAKTQAQTSPNFIILRAYALPSLHRSFAWRFVSFVSFMLSSLWTAWRQPQVDLVMGTSPPLTQALAAWLVAFTRRRPLLLELRDLWPDFAIALGVLKNPVFIRLARWAEMFLYHRAAHILVNSPAYRDYLLGKGIPDAKISVVANGSDPDMFDPAVNGAQLRGELKLDGKCVVTYTGALGLANDIDALLKAADRLRDLPDVHFLIVGDGKERARLEADARRQNLANVTFAGTRPKSAMPEVLSASNMCVATLRNIEAFTTTYPNKVFDYMAAGRPTVLAIGGVIQQVIAQSRGGVCVQPGDDRAIAEAIRYLHDHGDEARQMGLQARDYLVAHFNRHKQAELFVDVVERTAALGPRSRARTA